MWPCTGVPPPITPMESDSSDVSITVTWDMPMDIDIDHYRIEYRVKVDLSDWVAVMVNDTLTSYEIMGLSPITTYEVRIFAISTEGVPSVSADVISITTEGMMYVGIHVCMYVIITVMLFCVKRWEVLPYLLWVKYKYTRQMIDLKVQSALTLNAEWITWLWKSHDHVSADEFVS